MANNRFREAGVATRAANALREAGFALVQIAPNLPRVGRLDVLAWAANENGELVPHTVVEIKRGIRPEPSLPQLAQTQAALGTVEHYVLTDEQWYRAEPGLRTLKSVKGPEGPTHSTGIISDVDLATELVVQQLGAFRDQQRDRDAGGLELFNKVASLEKSAPGIRTVSGQFIPVKPETLWRAFRNAVATVARRSKTTVGTHTTPPEVAHAAAALLGNKLSGFILDPFCGLGEFLWATADRALEESRTIRLMGADLDSEVAETSRGLASLCPVSATVQVRDAISAEQPMADAVISAPPFALRLQEPHGLLNGEVTRSGDLAAIDLCVRALKPGGRAVIQVPPGITQQRIAENYRRFIATEFRVAALVGCPSGAVAGSQVKSILIVIDRADAGETFVAQLGEDWEMQLRVGSPVLSAAIEHIDSVGGME